MPYQDPTKWKEYFEKIKKRKNNRKNTMNKIKKRSKNIKKNVTTA